MARIRSIKPEFPHSESMGRVSRDARLLFIELWTICDDSGRTRAVSRMLASLLFPYDDDARELIDGWLDELEREHCIVRYQADGQSYLQVCKWLIHQKIDKPSASKIPPPPGSKDEHADEPFVEPSRTLGEGSANPRGGVDEGSSEDRIGEESSREDLKDEGLRPLPSPVPGKASPTCPADQILDLYHATLPVLPRVVALTDKRKRLLSARWREVVTEDHLTREEGIEFFRRYFAKVAASKFLTGKTKPNGDGRTFRADFEWLLLPSNFIKVHEGRYA